VTDVELDAVTIRRGSRTVRVRTRTILWAAGMQGSPLGRLLADKTGAKLDKQGRIAVQPDLTLPGFPEVFVLGDLACFEHQDGKPLPGVAPVAMQQGRYAAELIRQRIRGENLPPFHYTDRGSLAVIGRNAAVAKLGWLHLSGFPAWLLWVFIHLAFLIQFQNRILVLAQWTWSYFTRNRSALLIPEKNAVSSPKDTFNADRSRVSTNEENGMNKVPAKENVNSQSVAD
jgi:NADH dehydrogenase